MLLQETAARSKHEQLVSLAQQSEKAKQDAEATARRNAEGLKQGHRVSEWVGNKGRGGDSSLFVKLDLRIISVNLSFMVRLTIIDRHRRPSWSRCNRSTLPK